MSLKTTIRLSLEWAIRCFTKEHVYNIPVRALRINEEAIEFAQACLVSREKMHKLVDAVYNRPKGEVKDEVTHLLMTTVVFCAAHGLDPEQLLEDEVSRVLSQPPDRWIKRNTEKNILGFGIDPADKRDGI